jgi:hypothetical protein
MLREMLAALALVACQRSTTFEQLPPPDRPPSLTVLPKPPPPPPPPKSEAIGPPPALAALLASHAACRVWIDTVELARARADALIDRLGRWDSWMNGIYGCVSEPTHVRITCGEGTVTFETSCGNVTLAGEQRGWSEAMSASFRQLR